MIHQTLRVSNLTHRLIAVAFLGLCLLTQATFANAATDGFVPNAGQMDSIVQFYGTSSLVDVFFTSDRVVFDLKDPEALAELREALDDYDNTLPLPNRRGQALYLTFPGALADVELIPANENTPRYNFFMGNKTSNWISDQASFSTLTYRNLWPGVDLVFTLDHGDLSYEIVGDASLVTLEWSGADQTLATAGGMELLTSYGTLIDNGANIFRSHEIGNDNLVFATRGAGALLWSTLMGGSNNDSGTTIVAASNGDIFVAGETLSPDFPGTPGAYDEAFDNLLDIFISRFSNEGSQLVWSSFLGSSSNDYVNAIILDNNDNPIIGGRSGSSYPTTSGAFDETFNGGALDAIVTKLTNDGSSLIFSTYIGGNADEATFDLLQNSNGDLVCAGYTGSTDFPTTAGVIQNTFAGPPYDFTVSILSSDGTTLNASTYIGGSDRDACRGLAIDSNGDFFLSGFTFSADFPVTAGTFQTTKGTIDDAALAKISGDLTTLYWATFIGGNNSERAHCIDLDASGDPVIAGYTASTDFPTSPGVLQENSNSGNDCFVAKFNSADGTRDWSTYVQGSSDEDILSLVVDANDNPLFTGWTNSSNFPVNNLGYDNTHNGGEDIFVSRLSPDGTALLWGTFLGDTGDERALEVTLDADDNPIITGRTTSTSFPVSSWAYDQTHNGGTDAILARFDTGDANLSISAASNQTACGSSTAVTFTYNPDLPHSPPMRGYSVRIQAPLGLTFSPSDISVLSPLGGVNDTFQIIETAAGDCTIDFSFLDQGAGLSTIADLFIIDMHGTADGLVTIGVASGDFRDLDNHPFDVDLLNTIDIAVDCTPPNVPTLDAEPLFTFGTSNTLGWSDESATGAATYNVQASDQSDFSVISFESTFMAGLTYQFTGLTNATTYYFRVISRDANNQESVPSPSVFSTQDADGPVSSVDALPALVPITFNVAYTASDALSGIFDVELFYNFNGGTFAPVGSFTSSPISFTATDGDGTYGFYTVATDNVGNIEVAPGVADASTVVDTTPPNIPTLTAEPLFTAGAVNTVFSSDESSSGAVSYNFQISQLGDFSVVDSESGNIPGLSYEFTGLTDGVIYFYRVAAIDNLGNVSGFSPIVSSTQDATAPVSSVDPVADQGSTTFDVAYTASDAGVGSITVELFANFEGGAFVSQGSFGTSPISFTAINGEGTYGFFTVATDGLGNIEVTPAAAQASCVLDLTAPASSVSALSAYQTTGVFTVIATGTDNLVGIAAFELFYSMNAGPWTSAGTTVDGNFSFTSPGDGNFGFYSIAIDNVGNTEAAPAGADATTIVDTTGPTGTFAINAGASNTNNTSVTLDQAISGALEMRFSNDNITFSEGWVAYNASHPWVIDSGEGAQTVYGEFRDVANNTIQITDTINLDLTATAVVTMLAVSPAHESINLSWNNPNDSDFDHIEIWRGLLHDGASATVYPDYVGGIIPTSPADRAAALASTEWGLAGTVGGGVEIFIDAVVTRGVYYYEAFAVDTAGNFSAPHGQMPEATNYILGDMAVAFDGLVNVADISVLGATYGLNDGEVGYNNHADIGPTDDVSGSGIPLPDDFIGFEDLMITTLNYGLSGKSSDDSQSKSNDPVLLSWSQSSTNSYTLRLLSGDSALKGLNISADLPEGTNISVTAGDLLGNQGQPIFLRNIAAHGLDTGCALLGSGISIEGEGDLLIVTLPDSPDLDILALDNLEFTLRDADNQDLEFSFEMASSVEIPVSFAMGQNYPNPFNPMTSISFSLPRAENVQLAIYGVDGRRIAVLVNESMDAGHHQITWTGRDETGQQVASGVYFYRITAGEFSDVQKMTLMK